MVDFLTEEEWLAREQRFLQRLQDLRISVALINRANDEYKELLAKQLDLDKWNDYLACDGQPRPNLPAEIRHFVARLRSEEQLAADSDINWVLPVNERSILSHAPDRQDMTRRTLEETLKPNIGKLYEDTVLAILEAHKRVGRVLRNEIELRSIPILRALELSKIPIELHREIENFFDKLSYRVICAPEAYMTNEGSMLSYYCYNCSDYNFQIWGLKDVPIRFDYLQLPLMYSDLKCIQLTLQLPLSVLSDNLTLRCVHTLFDPYSHLAKSYEVSLDSTNSPTCGIMDIEDSLTSEWVTQTDIQEELMTKMEAQMEAYMQAMGIIEAAKVVREQKRANNEKAPSVPKAPKMPQAVPEGKFPDPYQMFLKQNKQQCADFFNENFHPDHINLLPYEVNLRHYIIMGGVFSIVFVRKPRHTAFEKLNLTLHEDGRVLAVVLNQLERSSGSTTADSSQLATLQRPIELEVTDSQLNLHLGPDELPFYFITFKVPAHLCLWGEPLVCQFVEQVTEGPIIEDDVLVEEVDKKNKKKRNRKPTDSVRLTNDAIRKSTRYTKVEKNKLLVTDEREYRDSSNLYTASVLDKLRKSNIESDALSIDVGQNFELNVDPLSRPRASLLKKFCIPRIISSFRFPQEFKDEQLHEQTTKKATGPMYRRRLDDSPITEDIKEFTFSYEDQAEPERLYPKFPKTPKMTEGSDFSEATLYGLINTLDGIKRQYEVSPKKLAEQTVQGVKVNKRQKIKEIPVRNIRSTFTARRSAAPGMARRSTLPSHGPITVQNFEEEMEMERRESEADATTKRKSKQTSLTITESSRRAEPIKIIHWTTEFILESNFDKKSQTLTVKTDRLGNFGFAYPRYTHFPFRHWELEVNEENPDEIFFTLDTYHVRVVFIINKAGIRGYAIDVPKEYIAKPVKYLDIEKPIGDIVELRKLFQDMNLNVFAELDACFYIDQGYFSQKHLAAELHIYDVIAVHCKLMKFKRSDWNRLATDRDIVLCLRNTKDALEVTVRVTPEASTFVEISELCSEDLSTYKLDYHSTWRNIGIYTDLHQLINSMYPHATDVRNRDAGQMFYLRKLLHAIRPLSFS